MHPSKQKRPLRVLNYAVNGIGLGHISRLIAINRWLRRLLGVLDIDTEILFLTSSEADALAYHNNFAAFKIPSKTSIARANLSPERYRQLAKQWVWNSVGLFAPDVMIVDTFPNGSLNELGSIADFGFKKILVYRAVRDEQAREQQFQSALQMYDRIIRTVENDAENDDNYDALPESVEARTHIVGAIMIRERGELLSRTAAREQLGIHPGAFACYVSAGGGGDANAEQLFERLVRIAESEQDVQFVIGAGALYRGREFAAANVRWSYRTNGVEFLQAFDFAVSAGGYNTVYELLFAEIPTLFFHQERLFDDQRERIERLAAQGLCIIATSDEHSLQGGLTQLKNPATRQRIRATLRANGLQNHARASARLILEEVLSDDDLDYAESVFRAGIDGIGLLGFLTAHGLEESAFLKTFTILNFERRAAERRHRAQTTLAVLNGTSTAYSVNGTLTEYEAADADGTSIAASSLRLLMFAETHVLSLLSVWRLLRRVIVEVATAEAAVERTIQYLDEWRFAAHISQQTLDEFVETTEITTFPTTISGDH
jgi:UDP-N-acetylglucosamine--N-acetylmuramyl-(pentapeptide) pyrophosphoryl-undecaprenol N-acetylglucosamine transferase